MIGNMNKLVQTPRHTEITLYTQLQFIAIHTNLLGIIKYVLYIFYVFKIFLIKDRRMHLNL